MITSVDLVQTTLQFPVRLEMLVPSLLCRSIGSAIGLDFDFRPAIVAASHEGRPSYSFSAFRFATSLRQRLVSASAFQRFSVSLSFQRFISVGIFPALAFLILPHGLPAVFWLKWPVNPADAG